MRVIERGERLGLTLEARDPIGIACHGVGHHFDRDLASKSGIAGAIHLAHAAGAEEADDFVDANARASGECRQWLRWRLL